MAQKPEKLQNIDILNGGGVDSFLVRKGMGIAQLPASLLPQILTADKLLMPDGVTSINRRLQQISGTNLLINSVWTDERAIVNQQNQKEYTNNSYTIDGWFIGTDGGSVSLQDGKLHFKRDGSWMNFIQNIEKFDSMKGERLTFSVLADGRFGLVVQYKNDGYLFSDIVEREHGVHSFTFDLPTDATMFSVMLSIPDNNGQNFYAAKLEPGPFQTLAHMEGNTWVLNDPPPNYALELLKCQRYFVRMKNTESSAVSIGFGSKTAHNKVAITVPLAVPMRIKPTVKCSDPSLLRVIGSTGEQYDVTSFYGEALSANQLRISVTGNFSDMPYGLCVLCINGNGCIDIDANL